MICCGSIILTIQVLKTHQAIVERHLYPLYPIRMDVPMTAHAIVIAHQYPY